MTHSCPTRRSSDLLDRGAQRLACLLPARLRVAGHVADAGAGAVTVRLQACVTSPRLLDVQRQALGLLQQAPAVRQRGASLLLRAEVPLGTVAALIARTFLHVLHRAPLGLLHVR